MKKAPIILIVGIIFIAAFSRLLPHYPNFTPLGAMALFGAAYFKRKYLSILVPVVALIISDIILYSTFYSGTPFSITGHIYVYLGLVLITMMGWGVLKKVNVSRVFGGTLLASAIFFLVSNFGVWMQGLAYPKTPAGLMMAYEAGIPFFWNTLAGNIIFSGVLFGGYAMLTYFMPDLKLKPATYSSR